MNSSSEKYRRISLGIGLILLVLCTTFGQENESEHGSENGEFHRHSIGLIIGHGLIERGVRDNRSQSVSVPTWAINYNYRFSEKFALGLHNDIIIEEFVVEFDRIEGGVLEREYPVSMVVAGTFKPFEKLKLGLVAGGGAEWEKTESFGLIRFGLDYGIEIEEKKLEVLFVINYDILIEAYNTFTIGIGIAKLF